MIEWKDLRVLTPGTKVNYNGVDYIFQQECGGFYYQFDDGKNGIRIYVEDLLAFGRVIDQ